MSSNGAKTVSILLVEDDKIDQKAFLRALDKLKIGNPIRIASDGVEAWELMSGQSGDERMQRPYMIILDINMPRMNGIELLQKIRADKDLRDSIVFVLTTSNDEQDKFEAFNLNVAGYMLKTDMGNSFFKAVELVDNYWRVVEFPQSSAVAKRQAV